jgi:hypothetical protein
MLYLLRRLTRIFSLVTLLFWAFQTRHTILGAVDFAKTAPTRVRMGRGKEVGLGAEVHWALLRDPRLRGANIRVGSIDGSTVVLCAPSTETRANLAREVVSRLPGVRDVRLEDPAAHPAPITVTSAPLAG